MYTLENDFPSGEQSKEPQEAAQNSTAIPTEPQRDTPTKPPRRKLPRGYRVEHRDDGRKLAWLLFVSDKFNEAFKTEAAAKSAGFELVDRETEFGREVRAFDVREWRRYLEAKRLYFGGKEPDWPNLKKSTESLTVPEAVTRYILLRSTDGLAKGTQYQLKKKLGRLSASFHDKRLHEVTADDLRDWLKALNFADWTVKDHLKVVSTFWNYARREKWTDDDPTEAVKGPKIIQGEINILTVSECKKLFVKNRGWPVVGRLALESFGGLRFSSAGRLALKDLKWSEKGIELPARGHKSKRRHYLDGLPPNLWKWLKSAPAACWDMTERQYLEEKTKAFVRAGVTSSQNCLRHSFATYHVAAFKDAALTAVLMQHTSPATLYRFYKGKATQKDGLAFFRI